MIKTVKIFNDKFNYNLTEIPGLKFLDHEEGDIEVQANTLERKGKDGVGLGPSTFGPFKLILRFFYRGKDLADYNLMKQRLRGLLFRRDPYYVVHSEMPGKKYAVYCESNAITDIFDRNGTFEITFNVFKGYSESLYKTDQFSLMSDKWQFGNGLIPDESISYKHTRQKFKIFNGSSDTINPRFHFLKIWIRANTDKSFKIVNKTTGDVFEFKGTLKKNQSLVLDGVYPYLDLKRCGRITNHGVISLAPGFNDFEVWGSLSNFEIEFVFNYIYR